MEQTLDLQTKYLCLLNKNELLDQQLEDFKKRGISTDLQPQIKALHDYNEMKDLTQVVLGYLANAEKVTITELHVRYNLPLD